MSGDPRWVNIWGRRLGFKRAVMLNRVKSVQGMMMGNLGGRVGYFRSIERPMTVTNRISSRSFVWCSAWYLLAVFGFCLAFLLCVVFGVFAWCHRVYLFGVLV